MANIQNAIISRILSVFLSRFSHKLTVMQNGVIIFYILSVFFSPFSHKTSFMCV